jgi:hypothetical protein
MGRLYTLKEVKKLLKLLIELFSVGVGMVE